MNAKPASEEPIAIAILNNMFWLNPSAAKGSSTNFRPSGQSFCYSRLLSRAAPCYQMMRESAKLYVLAAYRKVRKGNFLVSQFCE